MVSLAAFALGATPLRFVYVDPKGYVRLYGEPKVRSRVGRARQPDLSPDGKRFVYWVESDRVNGCEMWEHDLRTGRERSLRKGNMRSPVYSADGRIVFFTDSPNDSWDLYALDLAGCKARTILKEGGKVMSLTGPVALYDGTVIAQDGSRAYRLDAKGVLRSVLRYEELRLPLLGASDETIVPHPTIASRLLACVDTSDLDERVLGSSGVGSTLYVYDTKTRKARRILPRTVDVQAPRWTRDGKLVMFFGSKAGGESGVFSVCPDGTGLRFLVRGEEASMGLGRNGP